MADTAVADQLREEVSPTPQAIPKMVEERIRRGRERMRKKAPQRQMYYKFWRGETYSYVNSQNVLVAQDTVAWAAGGRMPDHRIRNSYPFIASIVQAKVSAATQRVPGYEVVPSTTEPEDAQAADLAAKVALYGYDEWRLRRATVKWVEHALVGGEGFVYPYFDTSIGPFVTDPNDDDGARGVGLGDVRVAVLSGNQVFWEPGVDFEDSRWVVIEQALPPDVVREEPGYIKGDLKADATAAESPTDDTPADLVLRREYLERPSAARPQGRRLVMANGRMILPEGTYPCENAKGEVLDEMVLLRLSYLTETDDRDRGLVELLVDLQRTIQDTWNKLLEWKNRCLNPQMVAPRGSNMARRDDTPGATWFYTPVGGQKPEWERPPPVPQELFQILDKAIEHVRAIAGDIDVQADPDVAARTAQAAIEESRLRWQSFLGDLAEGHSRLMRRCLYLVQRHYTEPRLIKIQGLFGPDLTLGFMGADLLGQADVRVSPESLAVKSRKSVVEETLLFADRQWISPRQAMSAVSSGNVDVLGQSFKHDVARANYIIQTIKRGPDELFGLRPNPDGSPGWMPRPFDKVEIHIEVFETWMKTTDWDRLEDGMREAGKLYYEALLQIQQQRQLEAQMQQQQMAEGLGMSNAAKPQQASPGPDQRAPEGGAGGPTPNQPSDQSVPKED